MSTLLRRPSAVPALFSPGPEVDPASWRPRTPVRSWSGSVAFLLPPLILAAELPFLRQAGTLLRLALPH